MAQTLDDVVKIAGKVDIRAFCEDNASAWLALMSESLTRWNRSGFCDCDAHCGPKKSLAISETRQSHAALRFKGAMESR